MGSRVTEIQINPIKPKDGLVAFASLVLDKGLYLGSIGIHSRPDGSDFRLTYPTKTVGQKQLNVYHPITKEVSKIIEEAVIAKFKDVMKLSSNDRHSSITEDEYDKYVKEDKQKQIDLELQMQDHTRADKDFLLSVSYLLEVASKASELFESSKPDQKRQLLNFLLKNCKLQGKKLIFELKTPFDTIAECSKTSIWLPGSDSNRRPIG